MQPSLTWQLCRADTVSSYRGMRLQSITLYACVPPKHEGLHTSGSGAPPAARTTDAHVLSWPPWIQSPEHSHTWQGIAMSPAVRNDPQHCIKWHRF